MSPKGPYKLCTVNKVPERAKILIGRVVEDVKEEYTIVYVKNAERIEDVKAMVEEQQPDVLFVASMWTSTESSEIQSIAQTTKPGIKTMAIPHGLQVEKGPDAVVEFLKEKWPGLVDN
ncbi:ea675b3a-e9d9-472e-b3e1-e31ff217dbed [Sclerotinia trifoliorum]|uniref:Ea675b3a-e9d9-472e-b3e1-e31ff217dbed n=1 Tax=Sclerotinia trifoliorum TaxID=28548 RepID=A0A8H2ZUS6_9HELO|nr:ea675b3a-e9d9-472e-b3e1-e31ff217dbed [Sclerotinia trifoliorum]